MSDVQQNENLLQKFLGKSDKKFVAQVGVMSLALLTERLSGEQYKAFLEDCVDNAVELHRVKVLGITKPQEESEQPVSNL